MLKITRKEAAKLRFKQAIKKPIPIGCVRMEEDFEVETMEGILQGKKGDWLMQGIQGELYPCDHKIFLETYILLDLDDEEEEPS